MIHEPAARLTSAPSPLERASDWFQRCIALFCLFQGISYWVRLLGFFEGAAWRFDLMPMHWQLAAVPLAVLFPFAAVGLWMLASWGPVIWLLCAATEIVMYSLFSDLYAWRPWLVFLHVFLIVCFGLLHLALHLQKRRAPINRG